MSGTQQNFSATYAPYAAQAGAALGVDPNVILGQWALESGYGTNTASQGYNVGSIMSGGQPLSYASPSAFEQSYVNTIQTDFPNAVGSGSNVYAFANGLATGTLGSYFGSQSPSSYALGISGTEATLSGTQAGNVTTLPQTTVTAQAPTSSTSSGCGILNGGVFTWSCWAGIAADAAFVVMGIGMIFFALGGASKGPAVVINAAKAAA